MSIPPVLSEEEARRARAERVRKAQIELSKRRLTEFAQFVDPTYHTAEHLEFIADKLSEVERFVLTKGREGIGRLMISMPPRSSKSVTVTQMFPAYMLGKHPDMRFILVAHTQELAGDFSRVIRNLIIQNEEYGEVFPDTMVSPESAAVERWHILGKRDPAMIAVGVGGAITGRGANIILIDDVVKNRKEAESPTYRKATQDFYKGTLRTRLEPGGAIVLVGTRWHEDDLQGWLIEQQKLGGEQWTVINLPALSEVDGDVIGRRLGEPLWEERFDFEALMEIKKGVGLYEWESQYQGHPKPPKGSKISISQFRYVNQPPPYLTWKCYWDLALSEAEEASFNARAVGAVDEFNNFYISMIEQKKEEWSRIADWMSATIKSGFIEHGIEKKLHGAAAVSQLMRDNKLKKKVFYGVEVDKGKLERALPWITRLEAGKVYLVRGEWNEAFIEQCRDFTGSNDKFDDQVDAVSGVYEMLTNPKWKKIKFLSAAQIANQGRVRTS